MNASLGAEGVGEGWEVEGRTPGHLIPKEELALEAFLGLAVPVAEAISAAPDEGVIHHNGKRVKPLSIA